MFCMIFNRIFLILSVATNYYIPRFIIFLISFLGSLRSKSFKIYKTIFHVLYDF